jgi:hypothetical protein
VTDADTSYDIAQAMYDAYGEQTDHKNVRGETLPPWTGLGDTVQRAWIAAANRAISIIQGPDSADE